MKQLHYMLYTICLAALLSACERELPYNVGNQETQLVMNALLDVNKEENLVHLCLSEPHSTRPVTQATVTLYINDRQAETAEETEYDNRVKTYRLRSRLQSGDRLRLEAVAEEGRYHATGEVTVPQPPEAIQVDTFPARIKQYGSYDPARRFRITVHDPAGADNYYRLAIAYTNRFDGTNWAGRDTTIYVHREAEIINREDVVLTDGRPGSTDPDDADENDVMGNYIENRYNVFNDNRFSGTSYDLRVYTDLMEYWYPSDFPDTYTNNTTITVRLYSLTETGYRYLRTLNTLESDNYDTTLMEPAIIPGNVQGGLGIVDACIATEAHIALPEQVLVNEVYEGFTR